MTCCCVQQLFLIDWAAVLWSQLLQELPSAGAVAASAGALFLVGTTESSAQSTDPNAWLEGVTNATLESHETSYIMLSS